MPTMFRTEANEGGLRWIDGEFITPVEVERVEHLKVLVNGTWHPLKCKTTQYHRTWDMAYAYIIQLAEDRALRFRKMSSLADRDLELVANLKAKV